MVTFKNISAKRKNLNWGKKTHTYIYSSQGTSFFKIHLSSSLKLRKWEHSMDNKGTLGHCTDLNKESNGISYTVFQSKTSHQHIEFLYSDYKLKEWKYVFMWKMK